MKDCILKTDDERFNEVVDEVRIVLSKAVNTPAKLLYGNLFVKREK